MESINIKKFDNIVNHLKNNIKSDEYDIFDRILQINKLKTKVPMNPKDLEQENAIAAKLSFLNDVDRTLNL